MSASYSDSWQTKEERINTKPNINSPCEHQNSPSGSETQSSEGSGKSNSKVQLKPIVKFDLETSSSSGDEAGKPLKTPFPRHSPPIRRSNATNLDPTKHRQRIERRPIQIYGLTANSTTEESSQQLRSETVTNSSTSHYPPTPPSVADLGPQNGPITSKGDFGPLLVGSLSDTHQVNGLLDDTQIELLTSLYFSADPNVDAYIASQPINFIKNSHSNVMSTLVTPNPSMLAQKETQKRLVGFLTELNPQQLHNTPCPSCIEQIKRIKFKNTSNRIISLSISTAATVGSFLGFSLSKSVLQPEAETRLVLTLVGTSTLPSSSLTILTVKEILPTSSDSSSSDARVENYLFGSRAVLKPSSDTNFWKIDLSQIVEERRSVFFTTNSYTVSKVSLFGVQLCSKVYKRKSSLSDLSAFQREIALLTNPKLYHNNIIALIGASSRSPFRIITQPWNDTLAASLGLLPKSSFALSLASQFNSVLPLHNSKPNLHVMKLISPISESEFENQFNQVENLETLEHQILFAQDIISAVAHLHSYNYVHRDLNSQAIALVNSVHPILAHLDTVELENLASISKPVNVLSIWVAPETSSHGIYSKASDVYAIGIILFELLIGVPLPYVAVPATPFERILLSWKTQLDRMDPTSPQCSTYQLLFHIISTCVDHDPNLRPNLVALHSQLESL